MQAKHGPVKVREESTCGSSSFRLAYRLAIEILRKGAWIVDIIAARLSASVCRKSGAVGVTTKFQRTTTPHRCKVSAPVNDESDMGGHSLSCSRIAFSDSVIERQVSSASCLVFWCLDQGEPRLQLPFVHMAGIVEPRLCERPKGSRCTFICTPVAASVFAQTHAKDISLKLTAVVIE